MLPIEVLRRVDLGRHAARGADFFPVAVVLAPEGRAPGCVQSIQRHITLSQPGAECGDGCVAKTFGVVAGVLIVHVPERQGGVVARVLRQAGDKPDDGFVIGGAVRAIMPPRAVPKGDAFCRHR